jgi:uncharacterized protein with gpF-like domain
VIEKLEASGQRLEARVSDSFFEFLNDDFDALAEVLGKGLLASYLLALDQVMAETRRGRAEFAEGDDPENADANKPDAVQAETMTAGPVKLRFNVPPDEAIDYFKSKRIVTRKAFDKLAEDARASAFTVSRIYKQDVLDGFKSEITKSLEEGTAQGTVIKRFKEILSGAGYKGERMLGNFHLETIFRSNMQMAYGVGRRRALEEVADDLPYWTYHDVGDDRVRPQHHALNGVTLPAKHEFWNTHFCPWDFN